MAATITQRIAIEGGKEVLEALKKLGAEGKKAFEEIQKSADKVKGPPASFASNIERLQKSLSNVGGGFIDIGESLTSAGRKFSFVGAAIGGLVVSFGFLAKSASDAADAMDKNAQKAGLSIEAYGELAFAAEQNDVAAEAFTTSMGKLNKEIDAAVNGSASSAQKFARLGISLDKLKTNSPEETFLQLIDAFSKMEDGATKSAAAINIFGRGGVALIPLLNQTRAGIEELSQQFIDLGLGFTKEQAAIGDAFGDSLNLLGRAITALKDQIGLIFVPALTAASDAMLEFIKNNKDAIIGFVQGLVDAFQALPAGVQTTIGALVGLAVVLGPIIVAVGLFVQVIGFALGGLSSLVGAIALLASPIGVTVVAIAALIAIMVSLAVAVSKNWVEIKAAFQNGVASVLRLLADIIGRASAAAEAIVQPFLDWFDKLWEKAKSVFTSVIKWLGEIIEKATNAARAITGAGKAGGAGAQGLAGGGAVRGQGTSTSDSIPAWLSHGEFVINARAVRKYGLALFARLNSGMLPGFADGGPVMPSTSLVGAREGALHVLNLTIDGETFRGLIAPDEVAQRLQAFARRKQIVSAGRKQFAFSA